VYYMGVHNRSGGRGGGSKPTQVRFVIFYWLSITHSPHDAQPNSEYVTVIKSETPFISDIYYSPINSVRIVVFQAWIDFKLTWDPAVYGGLKVVRLPYDAVWKPDILLYNK